MSTHTRLQTVGQVMRQPTTIEPGAHLAAAAYVIEHRHDPALVVVSHDTHEPVAMITDAEITRAVAHRRDLENTRVKEVARRKLVPVRADATVEDAARLMVSQRVHHLPVVDDHGVVGVVGLRDLYEVSFPAP